MSEAVNSSLFIYADNSCLIFQHKDVEEIEKALNNDSENIWDWFVDNKLRIHFGEEKTESILFASQCNIKNIKKLNIKFKDIETKQHSQVTHLGCVMDETMPGEPTVLQVINTVNPVQTTTRLRRPMLSPPKPISIQSLLYKMTTCLTQPATIFFVSQMKKNLSKTTTTKLYPV